MPHPYSKLSDDELIVLARSSDPGARHRRKAVCEELYARLVASKRKEANGESYASWTSNEASGG